MKKPKFLKLDGFNHEGGYITCPLDSLKLWIKEKYGI